MLTLPCVMFHLILEIRSFLYNFSENFRFFKYIFYYSYEYNTTKYYLFKISKIQIKTYHFANVIYVKCVSYVSCLYYSITIKNVSESQLFDFKSYCGLTILIFLFLWPGSYRMPKTFEHNNIILNRYSLLKYFYLKIE